MTEQMHKRLTEEQEIGNWKLENWGRHANMHLTRKSFSSPQKIM